LKNEGKIMKWLVNEVLGPIARRVGGQAAAALVALGMAQVHENAVAAAIAWALLSAAEVGVSVASRKKLVKTVTKNWGRNNG
jgi:anti-sigma factor RsiW